MATITEYISVSTHGQGHIIDITSQAMEIIHKHNVQSGILCLFVPGSTAAITTIEYEPGLQKDLNIFLEKIIPRNAHYHHHDTWHDDNDSSHVRASMIGPSICVPIIDGNLTLGTWQQIVVIECDTQKRNRKIISQIVY